MAFPISNLFIESLPSGVRRALLAQLESVPLPVNKVLYEPQHAARYVHFITSGMTSIVTTMETGEVAEVGVVTREGIPESLHLLGPAHVHTRGFMQIAGTGLRMPFKTFEQEFMTDEVVARQVMRLVQWQSLTLGQLAACNRLHEVEERLARWLLTVQDRIGEPDLPLTQEFLSNMLGTRRSTVTIIAGTLQRSGLIEYKRGHVRIVDRHGLENAACECYGITQRLFEGLYQDRRTSLETGVPVIS